MGIPIDTLAAAPTPTQLMELLDAEIVTVDIADLRMALHVVDRARDEAGGVEGLRPIVVHRSSMMIVDGDQRVAAAKKSGLATVPATMFHGTEAEARLLAINLYANRRPLPIRDRRALGQRLLSACPTWSDRAIASFVGVSDKTIAAIRRSMAHGDPPVGVPPRAPPSLPASPQLGPLAQWIRALPV